MEFKLPSTWRILAVIVVLSAALVSVYFIAQPRQQTLRTEDTIEFSKITSAEKPEEFFGALAAEDDVLSSGETQVTVYNQNLALVKEGREVDLTEGFNQVKYQDVPTQINATSVIFQDTTDDSTEVLEQTYEYDLVSQQKLLEKYIDEEITVFSNIDNGVKEYRGKLISHKDGVVLEIGNGVVGIRDIQSIQFPRLPEGLITKPTLVWSIFATVAGKRNILTSYLTGGMTWRADYVAKISEDDTQIDLKGWTTINNTSGTAYPNATLKLVAGDVNIIQPQLARRGFEDFEMAMDMAVSAPTAGGFVEESFFEYHLYSLGRKTNLKDNEQKQISLMNAQDVSVKKEFVYESSKSFDKVRIVLETENSEEKGLGIPLPKGIVRVYKEDSSGHLQFIGEDSIDHTPKDEEIEVFVGNAFDVVPERKVTESSRTGRLLDFGGRCTLQDISIEIRNHKEEAIEVKIVEKIYGPSIRIIEPNFEVEKEDENTYIFRMPVEADGENTLTYTSEVCF